MSWAAEISTRLGLNFPVSCRSIDSTMKELPLMIVNRFTVSKFKKVEYPSSVSVLVRTSSTALQTGKVARRLPGEHRACRF